MEAKLDIWIVLFMAAAAQGVFLSIMLIVNRSKGGRVKAEQILLSALMLLFTITIAYYTTYWTGVNREFVDWRFGIILRFPFLFGPLAYFYVYHTTHKAYPKYSWLHLVPFILLNIFFYNINLIVPGFQSYQIFNVLMVFHVTAYSLVNLYLTRRQKSKWLMKVSLSFAGYGVCLALFYILTWTGVIKIYHDYMVSMGMTVFIYFIGYHGFRNPNSLINTGTEKKYQKSSLTDNALNAIIEKLDLLMKTEKLFTNGNLKLTEVAARLELTPHALSQAVNVSKEKKFTDYLNELRVEEAIALMHKSEYQDTKLLAVAIDSGFNNKTSFLNAFKKQTGQSPSEFRKSVYSKAS